MKNVLASDITKIVQKYKSYINSICRRFYIAGGTAEDLFEEGVIGLLEACQNYNGESLFEDRFDAFAKLCIKRQIIDAIKKAKQEGRRVISVGTTSTRTLESCYKFHGDIKACSMDTNIFIYPGYEFKAIDGLITNFHLPESTLIMLVSALAGYENCMAAYKHAVEEKYRFYSFGDAMIIL